MTDWVKSAATLADDWKTVKSEAKTAIKKLPDAKEPDFNKNLSDALIKMHKLNKASRIKDGSVKRPSVGDVSKVHTGVFNILADYTKKVQSSKSLPDDVKSKYRSGLKWIFQVTTQLEDELAKY